MTAIAGASAGVKDMADGSLRITIEFEPKDAKEAYALFGARGTPVALAALAVGYQAAPTEPRKDTRGPLCREACDYCAMPEFRDWMQFEHAALAGSANDARLWLLGVLGLNSRKELDTNADGAARFIARVRLPFMRYMKTRKGVTA